MLSLGYRASHVMTNFKALSFRIFGDSMVPRDITRGLARGSKVVIARQLWGGIVLVNVNGRQKRGSVFRRCLKIDSDYILEDLVERAFIG